jgi:hypothetical protein
VLRVLRATVSNLGRMCSLRYLLYPRMCRNNASKRPIIVIVYRSFSWAKHNSVGVSGSNLVRVSDYLVAFSDVIRSVQANAMLTGISDRTSTQRHVSDNWQEKARVSGGWGGDCTMSIL